MCHLYAKSWEGFGKNITHINNLGGVGKVLVFEQCTISRERIASKTLPPWDSAVADFISSAQCLIWQFSSHGWEKCLITVVYYVNKGKGLCNLFWWKSKYFMILWSVSWVHFINPSIDIRNECCIYYNLNVLVVLLGFLPTNLKITCSKQNC